MNENFKKKRPAVELHPKSWTQNPTERGALQVQFDGSLF